MRGYLGEFAVDLSQTEFANYATTDWVMYFISRYGQIDGHHHKAWVIDQVARILKDTPVIVKEARWTNGHREYRVHLDEPSNNYKEWVEMMTGEVSEDGEPEYDYYEGIAP